MLSGESESMAGSGERTEIIRIAGDGGMAGIEIGTIWKFDGPTFHYLEFSSETTSATGPPTTSLLEILNPHPKYIITIV